MQVIVHGIGIFVFVVVVLGLIAMALYPTFREGNY